MFKVQAKQVEDSSSYLSEVFVIGGMDRALSVGNKLIDSTECEIVEIFRQGSGNLVAVLKKAARAI